MAPDRKLTPDVQPNSQPNVSKRVCVSPRSGAVMPCGHDHPKSWKKGQSGNPRGSTAKQRMIRAFEDAVKEGAMRDAILNAQQIACDKSHPLAMTALKWLFDRGVGPVAEDVERKAVSVSITLRPARANGEEPVIELAAQEVKQLGPVDLTDETQT